MTLIQMSRRVVEEALYVEAGEVVQVDDETAARLVADGAARPYADVRAEARTEVDEARDAARAAVAEAEDRPEEPLA